MSLLLINYSGVEEEIGLSNGAVVYAAFNYDAENADELSFEMGDRLTVTRRGDECEQEWWWCSVGGGGDDEREGYVPRNLISVLYLLVNLILTFW